VNKDDVDSATFIIQADMSTKAQTEKPQYASNREALVSFEKQLAEKYRSFASKYSMTEEELKSRYVLDEDVLPYEDNEQIRRLIRCVAMANHLLGKGLP
jgi:hypothetical protein